MSAEYGQEPGEHPALKNFNAPLEHIKAIGSKALKWAAKAAIVIGVGAALLALAPAGVLSVLNTVTFGLSGALIGEGGIAAAMGALWTGVKAGGIVGLLLGGISGAAESSDVVADKKEEVIAAYDRLEARQERVALLGQRREQQRMAMAQQAQSMGLTPGVGLPSLPDGSERGMG